MSIVCNANEQPLLLQPCFNLDIAFALDFADAVIQAVFDQRLQQQLKHHELLGIGTAIPQHLEFILIPHLLNLNIGVGILQLFFKRNIFMLVIQGCF
ncbi:hypothetical protein D3C85_1564900 [compost metagenome]